MRIPGFTADAALRQATRQNRTAGPGFSTGERGVIAAQSVTSPPVARLPVECTRHTQLTFFGTHCVCWTCRDPFGNIQSQECFDGKYSRSWCGDVDR
jgi:hypothetical protein